ncbi:MAG: hypothetical protein A3K22_00955 [Deltaproteobacteria bacterium RBG_16_42_7]|nr:MAG: hypothetical protein A3K22_00955 [Deltaproteobacteria bacterium RBG_16_42_7]
MPAYPTLSQNPEYPLKEAREDNVLRSSFEGGYEQTRPQFTRIRHSWTLTYKMLPTTDKELLTTFIDTVKGGADAFTWMNPQDSQTYTVRFTTPLAFKYVQFEFWNVEFILREV